MENLIKALQIFLKYGNRKWPTHCEHDVLLVLCDPNIVSEEDTKALESLGFDPGEECSNYEGCFYSYHYGSA